MQVLVNNPTSLMLQNTKSSSGVTDVQEFTDYAVANWRQDADAKLATLTTFGNQRQCTFFNN